MKPGNFFGEIAVITNLKRTCTVSAVNNIICGQISKKDLNDLIKAN